VKFEGWDGFYPHTKHPTDVYTPEELEEIVSKLPIHNPSAIRAPKTAGERLDDRFTSWADSGRSKAGSKPRVTPASKSKQKRGWSEGKTVGVGLLVGFLLISGLGDCEGSGDCIDSYGQVRIDNC